jgi:hypothetical protein
VSRWLLGCGLALETAEPLSLWSTRDVFTCRPARVQVTVLEVLQGQPGIIPLLEYGVTSRISDQRQWLLVFPRYGGSLREWRQRWRGRGLTCGDLRVYLRLFLQVRRAPSMLLWGLCWHSRNVHRSRSRAAS